MMAEPMNGPKILTASMKAQTVNKPTHLNNSYSVNYKNFSLEMDDDSTTVTDTYHEIYGVQLLDDIHNYLPALLYDTDRFRTIGDVLQYLGSRAYHYNDEVYTQNVEDWRRRTAQSNVGRAQVPRQPSLFSASGITNQLFHGPGLGLASGSGLGRGFSTGLSASFTRPFLNDPVNPPHYNLVNTLLQFSRSAATGTGATTGATPGATTSTIPRRVASTTTESLLRAFPPNFFDPVPVIPTPAQIEAGTHLSVAGADIGLGPGPNDNLCSICQEDWTNGDNLRIINHCSHIYHRACIDRWFESHVHCPLCRHDIRISEAEPRADSEEPDAEMLARAQAQADAQEELFRREWGGALDSPLPSPRPSPQGLPQVFPIESTIGLMDVSDPIIDLDEDTFGMDLINNLYHMRDISGASPEVLAAAAIFFDESFYDDESDSYSEDRDSLP
jgi:hypothetical protein